MKPKNLQGFDVYMFVTPETRAEYKKNLETKTGNTYEFHEYGETINTFTLHCLAARRVNPTLKKQLEAQS